MASPVSKVAAHRLLGLAGERFAADFLHKNGYNVIERNWRYGHLELDIICEWRGWIVFVEVKTRRTAICGGAAAAVNPEKQRKLTTAARGWLTVHKLWHKPCRFDVLCLTASANGFSVEHFCNAFEYRHALDSSYSYW